MDMCRVDNADALLPTKSECRGEFWHHGVRLRRLRLRAFGNKVVLHVDDDHDCRPWVDVVYAGGHRKPSLLMAPHAEFASCERGVKRLNCPMCDRAPMATGDACSCPIPGTSISRMISRTRHRMRPASSGLLRRLESHPAN